MTKKKEQFKPVVVKETFLGEIDVNEYFRKLIIERIRRDGYTVDDEQSKSSKEEQES